ncbi:MAG: hypothetical protein Ta2D_07570 [Rickettsiales bacterium]|nr:MAG: hypothetical protein Ta2D_07570 [Rickettsiales bacterium]
MTDNNKKKTRTQKEMTRGILPKVRKIPQVENTLPVEPIVSPINSVRSYDSDDSFHNNDINQNEIFSYSLDGNVVVLDIPDSSRSNSSENLEDTSTSNSTLGSGIEWEVEWGNLRPASSCSSSRSNTFYKAPKQVLGKLKKTKIFVSGYTLLPPLQPVPEEPDSKNSIKSVLPPLKDAPKETYSKNSIKNLAKKPDLQKKPDSPKGSSRGNGIS